MAGAGGTYNNNGATPFFNNAHDEMLKRAGSVACVRCHLVVPHGSKLSRLIGTSAMPARYQTATYPNQVTGFTKASGPGTYGVSNCANSCGNHPTSGGETW